MKKMLRALVLVLAWTVCLGVAAAAAELPEEERYGRMKLEEIGYLTDAYDRIAEGIGDVQEKIMLDDGSWYLTEEELEIVMDAVIKDYPEYFWVGGGYSYGMSGNEVVYVLPSYTMEPMEALVEKASMEAEARMLLSGIDESMSEFEKALEIHDRLAEHVVYDESANCHNAYGALVDGIAVCDGYTEAYQYLLAKVGIQSYKVTGDSRGEGHAWNLVRIDGEYYYTDVTWDDQNDRLYHAYFNLTEQVMTEDHNIHWEENYLPLPECTSVEANYFAVKGGVVSELTVEAVAEAFRSSEDGVARIYITPDVTEDVWLWYQNNVVAVATELEVTGGFSYGYGTVGREYQLTLSGYVPPAGADLTIAVPDGAKLLFDGETYFASGEGMVIENVANGTYDLQVKKAGCLTYTIQDIVVEGEAIDLGTITLLTGDVDGNDLINSRDINAFRREFGKSGEAIGNLAADMNGDNKVNSRDINVLRRNFGKSAVNDCTVVWQG